MMTSAYDIAAAFFDAVVAQARTADVLSDEHFTVDGTLLEAGAGLKSGHADIRDQPTTIVEQDVPCVRQLRFFSRALARAPRIGIGRRLVGIIPPRLPMKVDGGIARIVGGRRRPVLRTEAPGHQSVLSTTLGSTLDVRHAPGAAQTGLCAQAFPPAHDSTDAGIKSSRGVEITAPIILVLTWLVMIPL